LDKKFGENSSLGLSQGMKNKWYTQTKQDKDLLIVVNKSVVKEDNIIDKTFLQIKEFDSGTVNENNIQELKKKES